MCVYVCLKVVSFIRACTLTSNQSVCTTSYNLLWGCLYLLYLVDAHEFVYYITANEIYDRSTHKEIKHDHWKIIN